jgi:NADH-quinone oxidoreductase subunit E
MEVSSGPLASAQKFEKICQILDLHQRRPARLIPILQAVQDEYRYLPEDVLTFVATSLGVPPSRVFGVATFYAHFALEPKGKYVVRLCEKRKTTPDGLFTVETVACLGACGLAPVVVINEDIHGQITPEGAVSLIDAIAKKEAQ